VTDEERARLARQDWRDRLGLEPVVRAGRRWVLNKRDEGDCVFLDENTRCRIHNEFGASAKPVACQMFPFSARATPAGWQISLRFDCPSVVASEGEPLAQHRSGLARLVRTLTGFESGADDTTPLGRRLVATLDEINAVLDRLADWLTNDAHTAAKRWIGAARVTTTLAGASFAKVRGARFAELLDLLFAALPSEVKQVPEAPKERQRGMLRQLAFAHAEHVTLFEMRSGAISRLRRRFRQLRSARRFLEGLGPVPRLPGYEGEASFEAVEATRIDPDEATRLEEVLDRYVRVRLGGRTAFGQGYYGWPLFHGLTALWLGVATAGWLARYAAALRGVGAVSFADAGFALATVDRAATRLPALGTMAERARASYLLRDDGPARLIRAYSLVE
jgi:lysine-N-methylase